MENKEPVTRSPNSSHFISTSESRVIDRIRSWVAQCDSMTGCRHRFLTNPRHLPTRLIKIYAARPQPTVQLVAGEGHLPPDTNYITLSHCWGGVCKIQLRSDTENSLHRGIPLASLPQTFRDACQVGALLGITYIWIDSICIEQDDRADWNRESPNMHSVYGSAWLSLCALDSPNSDGGLFSNRELVTAVSTYVYPTDTKYGTENALIVNRCYDPFTAVDKGLANTRAWIFQERLLAPRTVFFGRDDVYWECACFALSDLNPSGMVVYRDKMPVSAIRKKFSQTTKPQSWIDPLFQQRLWHSIVKSYTGTNLTFTTDKLIALSGVAQYICGKSDDVYFAGLLRQYLVESLCWIPLIPQVRNSGGGSLGMNSCAPSWSWAKLNCPIEGAYHYISPFGREMLATVTAVSMFSAPFSASSAGEVSVRGLAIEPGWLGWTTFSPLQLSDDSVVAQCSILGPDWVMGMPHIPNFRGYGEELSSGAFVLPHLELEHSGVHRKDGLALYLDDPQSLTARDDLNRCWFLQVSRNQDFAGHELSCVWRVGLILLPVEDGKSSMLGAEVTRPEKIKQRLIYHRIGVWLFREPQISDLEDPGIEWVGDQWAGEYRARNNAIEPLFAKWLKDRPWMEVRII